MVAIPNPSPSPAQLAARVAKGGVLTILRSSGLLVGLGVLFLLVGWTATLLVPTAVRSAADSVGYGVQVPDEVALAELDQTSTVYAADGSVIAVLHDEIDRTVVPLAQIPDHVQHAVVTAEDRRFYEHQGYDIEGIGRAFVSNLQSGGVSQGGSTITQQLAKSEVGDEVSIQRKIAELAFAVALEEQLSKDEILERYLNQVYFGSGAYGIAAAAEEFYGVTVDQLDIPQAALLAALIREPSSGDPRRNPDTARARRDAVLVGMVEEGYVDPVELPELLARDLDIKPRVIEQPDDPFIAEAVKQEFYTLEEFGPDRLARNELLLRGGLEIYTSFDPGLQAKAEEIVLEYFPEPSPTAAIAAVDPRTGQVRAIFGGSDFDREQYNFATQGRRQPGSAFKPFVMATALEMGFSTEMKLAGNSPTMFPTGDKWEEEGVQNYGGASYGTLTMREALIRSVNTAFAQLMLVVGPENAVETARQMGINVEAATANIINPSIALGGFEIGVTPLEMASAYGTFAYAGAHVPAGLIDRVVDSDGHVIYQRDITPRQVLDPIVNETMVATMQSVVCCGTAGRASLASMGWRNAGKTGTAQSNADAWFVGYTPVLSTAVWTGHPEGRIRMPGATGGNIPARIWRDFMEFALTGIEPVEFPTDPPGDYRPPQQGEVEVPDVRRLDELEALRTLADEGLAGLPREVANAAPAGTVVWQSPRGGTIVPRGETIQLGVSTGEAPTEPTEGRPDATQPTTEPTATAPPTPVTEPPATDWPTGEPGGGPGGGGAPPPPGSGGGGGGGTPQPEPQPEPSEPPVWEAPEPPPPPEPPQEPAEGPTGGDPPQPPPESPDGGGG